MSCNDSKQTHVHEFVGSVRLAEIEEDPHNHRFAGVSGQAIESGCGHVHRICTRTDFFNNHFHEINAITGPAIPVGGGRHVHFVYACTTRNDGHRHRFIVATLIENPIGTDNMC